MGTALAVVDAGAADLRASRMKPISSPRLPNQERPCCPKVSALMRAAAAIPLVGLASSTASGQGMPHEATFQFQYSYYDEWQGGSEDRISVRAPMFLLNAPVAESTELQVGFVLDTLSGASPVYHDTLSGASGIGIQDERTAGDVTVTQYFEQFSVSLGGAFSHEDDYDSEGLNLSSKIWSSDKNTVLLLGVNGNRDTVGSSNNSELDERKKTFGGIVGITQVLDKNSVFQSNLSATFEDGYLNDPYKLGDNRPGSRDRFAWLARYVRFIEATQGSLHVDYRYYWDSWDLKAHTLDLSWYQPLGKDEQWLVRPRIRYYSQTDVDFYDSRDPVDITDDRLYTPDQRLAGFGSIGLGLKLIRQFGGGFSGSVNYDYVVQDSGWTVFSPGSPGIEQLTMSYFSLGFEKKF